MYMGASTSSKLTIITGYIVILIHIHQFEGPCVLKLPIGNGWELDVQAITTHCELQGIAIAQQVDFAVTRGLWLMEDEFRTWGGHFECCGIHSLTILVGRGKRL